MAKQFLIPIQYQVVFLKVDVYIMKLWLQFPTFRAKTA